MELGLHLLLFIAGDAQNGELHLKIGHFRPFLGSQGFQGHGAGGSVVFLFNVLVQVLEALVQFIFPGLHLCFQFIFRCHAPGGISQSCIDFLLL